MRALLSILALLAAIIGLVMGILPFGGIAFIPLTIGILLVAMAYVAGRKTNASTRFLKIISTLIIIGAILSIYRSVFDKNEVEQTQEIIEQEVESLEDAQEELKDLEIEN